MKKATKSTLSVAERIKRVVSWSSFFIVLIYGRTRLARKEKRPTLLIDPILCRTDAFSLSTPPDGDKTFDEIPLLLPHLLFFFFSTTITITVGLLKTNNNSYCCCCSRGRNNETTKRVVVIAIAHNVCSPTIHRLNQQNSKTAPYI